MSVSGISNPPDYNAVNNDKQSFKKAVKAYHDERLTGLTDEEREEIERRSMEYLKDNPIKTEHDRESFNDFVKSLLKKYGFKGDIDEYAATMAGEIQDKHNANNRATQDNITDHFQKASMEATAVRSKFF